MFTLCNCCVGNGSCFIFFKRKLQIFGCEFLFHVFLFSVPLQEVLTWQDKWMLKFECHQTLLLLQLKGVVWFLKHIAKCIFSLLGKELCSLNTDTRYHPFIWILQSDFNLGWIGIKMFRFGIDTIFFNCAHQMKTWSPNVV